MDRLVSISVRDVLEKVQPAIEAGLVNILSVEAIRSAFAERWPRKREQVEAFVERTFGRLSQAGDMMVCLNDTEFIMVQPSVSRTAALSLSAIVLKETLAFFLGKAAREDLRLFNVTAFVDGAFALEPASGKILDEVFGGGIDAGSPTLADESAQNCSAAAAPAVAPPAEDIKGRPTRRVRLVSPPDLDLDLAISLEPTWNVAAKVVASFLLRPSITLGEPGVAPRSVRAVDLSPNMAGEAALATIAFAADLISSRQAVVALHAPIAVNALGYSASRFRLLNAMRELPDKVRQLLILEIVGVSEGFPESRLTEIVSMLSPYCRAVLARAPNEMTDISLWRRCGLSGATLDCGQLDSAARGAHLRLGIFAGRASESKLSCVAYDLPSRTLVMAAWASGFTHVGGSLLSEKIGSPARLRRLSPVKLFCKTVSA